MRHVAKVLRNAKEHLVFARLATLGTLLSGAVQPLRDAGTAAVATGAEDGDDTAHDIPVPGLSAGALRFNPWAVCFLLIALCGGVLQRCAVATPRRM